MEKKMMKHKKRPRKSYHNLKSYDDELDLVLLLLEKSKGYERRMIEEIDKQLSKLSDLYNRSLPFYFKDGVDQKKLNELIISLGTPSGHFDTKLSKTLDEIERSVRTLQNDYITAWLILDYELTAMATAKSIGVSPVQYMLNIKINFNKANQTITKPWCKDNKTYIDRVKEATSKMDKDLRTVIVQGIRRGWSQERMTQIFRNITGTVEYKARRLIRTETMAVYSKVTKEIFLENGIEYVEIIGDAMCGGICLDYVGEVIPLKEAELGDDLPPYHPNCACSFCSYTEFTDNFEQDDTEDFEI